MKAHRLRQTWQNKRSSGQPLTARAPSWLRLRDGTFQLVPERAEIVRRIFNELADGLGRDMIATRLNRQAVAQRQGGVADQDNHYLPWGHGRQWHGGTVQKVTDSRAVLGEFQPHKLGFSETNGRHKIKRIPVGDPVRDYFPAVIDEALWAKARRSAQSRIAGSVMNSGGRKGTKFTNIFSGIARCAECNQPMNYRDRGVRSVPVLRCSGERSGMCSNQTKFKYMMLEDCVLSYAFQINNTTVTKEPAAIKNKEDALALLQYKLKEAQSQGERIVAEFGRGHRFSAAQLEKLENEVVLIEAGIARTQVELDDLRTALDPEEQISALTLMFDLMQNEASNEDLFRARSNINQMMKIKFKHMKFFKDSCVKIETEEGALYEFKDGYYIAPDGRLAPSAYSFFGLLPHRRK